MITANQNFLSLQKNYLFTEVAHRVAAYKAAHPGADVISLGIGDVTRPLVPAVIEALHRAVEENATEAGFRGYGPERGYPFLREAIAREYAALGVTLDPDEIHVSDGAKSDIGNFQELFGRDAVVAVTDPVYPVYVDSNVMAGRAGRLSGGAFSRIMYLPCTRENGFLPAFPETAPDLIYLCSPNNPVGNAMDRRTLEGWVRYAKEHGSVILFDAAYEAFITEPGIPHSIYEIDGAKEVAAEFRSYSKTAGFTGLRCGCTVVPSELAVSDGRGGTVPLGALWARRQSTKYNGCPYIVQRAAEAVHTSEGRAQVREVIRGYLKNASALLAAVRGMGLEAFGGVNSPYVWVATPGGMDSWDFFDRLLEGARIVCTPGSGFGAHGEGYVRLTAFGTPENTARAIERMARL